MSISRKLSLVFLGIIALLLVLGAVSLYSVAQLGSGLDTAINSTARKILLVGNLTSYFQQMKSESRGEEISYILRSLDTKGQCMVCHDSAFIGVQRDKFDSAGRSAMKNVDELTALAGGDAEKRTVVSMRSGIERWTGFYEQYRQLASAGKFLEGNDVMQGSIYPILEQNDRVRRN